MTDTNTNDLGWAPDPPSPANYHPQAVITVDITETWGVACSDCGTYVYAEQRADAFEAAALHCYPTGAAS